VWERDVRLYCTGMSYAMYYRISNIVGISLLKALIILET
jgi:hypothetical protein